MAELNNMEQNEINEQEKAAAEAAVNATVPAQAPAPAPQETEKKSLIQRAFPEGSKRKKAAKVVGTVFLGGLGLGLAFLAGSWHERRAGEEADVVDGDYTDVTDGPADDTAPFDNTDNF